MRIGLMKTSVIRVTEARLTPRHLAIARLNWTDTGKTL